MNISNLALLLSASLFVAALTAKGQGASMAFQPEPALMHTGTHAKPLATADSQTNRFHKKFPQLYTGMAIEIATSTFPMDRSAAVFRQFGNVYYEKLPEGSYSYLILANFSSKESALEFVSNNVRPRAEKARLILFSEGNRKVVRE